VEVGHASAHLFIRFLRRRVIAKEPVRILPGGNIIRVRHFRRSCHTIC
jgi:hypothetical protein